MDPLCKRLACATSDSRVLLINAQTGRPQRSLSSHENVVTSVRFLADRLDLVSSSWDGSVRKWRLGRDNQEVGRIDVGAACKSLAADTTSGTAAVGAQDGRVTLFAYETMKKVRTIKAHERDVSALSFIQDGELLLTASWDGTCRLWNVDTGTLVREIVQSGERIQAMTVSSEEATVFLGLHSGKILIVPLEGSTSPSVMPVHSDAVSVILQLPSSGQVVTGGWDATIRVWAPAHPQVHTQRTLTGVTDMKLCPRGNHLYVTDFSGTVTQWSLE